jgi:hypothetical protein
VLAAVEHRWARQDAAPRPVDASIIDTPEYKRSDSVLGFAPIPGVSATSKLVLRGRTIYETRYTIDELGLRVAPRCDCGSGTRAILFFGCSFTFGTGVQDDETLPYRVGVRTGSRYAIYNFAFDGYGPHQMLAALEQGIVAARVAQPPRYVFFAAIADHVRRAAGRARWDRAGPRYVRDGESVRLAGPFASTPAPPPRGLRERAGVMLARSAIVRRWRPRTGEEGEEETFVAIVDAARRRVETDFPGAEFRVLFWGMNDRALDLSRRLEERGVAVDLVAEIIPDWAADRDRYEIPDDPHPNARAYDAVARHLAERVIAAGE